MTCTAETPLAEWLAWLEQLHPVEIELGLERVQQVYARLGLSFAATRIITIAGTNGKGSSAAMLEAILRQAEVKVGVYTSPHILQFNERIRVNGVMATDAEITAALERIEAVRGDVSLTYFEYTTLAALQHFSVCGVDVMVLEVGLGGRLDAVNIMDADVALITTVDLDHQAWLGNSVEEIGREKAGIMRRGRVAVIADPDIPHSVIAYGNEIGAQLSIVQRDYDYSVEESGWTWTDVALGTIDALPVLELPGQHQYQNAAAVIEVIHRLPEVAITDVDVVHGLGDIRISGRGERLMLYQNWLFDVAHNPQAVRALVQTLRTTGPLLGMRHAVFAMLGDKDIAGSVALIAPFVDVWWVFDLGVPRAVSADTLRQIIQQQVADASIHSLQDAQRVFQALQAQASQQDEVLVFGSFHTVAQLMQQFI